MIHQTLILKLKKRKMINDFFFIMQDNFLHTFLNLLCKGKKPFCKYL